MATFDLEQPCALDSSVVLRRERFGGLAYQFRSRRLLLIKSRQLLAVMEGLGEHPSARDACLAAGVEDSELPKYSRALADLARNGVIVGRVSP